MVAYTVLFSWPLIAILVFSRLKPALAVSGALVAGYLLLPPRTTVDLPLLPAIDKEAMAAITAALIALVAARKHTLDTTATPLPGWLPKSKIVVFLLAMLVVGAIMTTVTNGNPRPVGGGRVLPGLSLYDSFSVLLSIGVALLPLLLGRRYLADSDSHRAFLITLVIGMLAYSFLALFEVRMSPQLNNWVYGYFPHDWRQHLRGGGFRPVVFLVHGLLVGLLLSLAFIAALVLFRTSSTETRTRYLGAAFWLLLTLALAKSLGAVMIAVAVAPLVLFLGARLQLIAAAAIMCLVISYPLTREVRIMPVDTIMSVAERVSPDRAGSFQFRLDNEDLLLAHARDRFLFGWGGWGRNFVYDERGRNITITDGYWILVVGQGGWARFIGEFGLLAFPILVLAFRSRQNGVTLATSGVALVLAANTIDLIPNSGITPITWLMAGALIGRLELGRVEDDTPTADHASTSSDRHRVARPTSPDPAQPARTSSPYTRFAGGEQATGAQRPNR